MSDIASLRDLHRQLIEKLDQRLTQVATREADLKRALEACAAERREIDRERHVLVQAAEIYDREFNEGVPTKPLFEQMPPVEPPPAAAPEEAIRPLRARIGPQRYRMFHTMRENDRPISSDDLAALTGLSKRRVKDQMLEDHAAGVVSSVPYPNGPVRYLLTPVGLDLLERFERYKKARGESLPAVSGPFLDDEEEDNHERDNSDISEIKDIAA